MASILFAKRDRVVLIECGTQSGSLTDVAKLKSALVAVAQTVASRI
jgi:hypothetical protein